MNVACGSFGAWFPELAADRLAPARLYCLPHAGGSSASFRAFARGLAGVFEVRAIELPGREQRAHEAPFLSVRALADAVLHFLEPELGDKPFALFGHSMGARVALELGCALARKNLPNPLWLVASGCPAPQLADPRAKLHELPDAELLLEIAKLNGTPRGVLESAELMQLLLPRLRADYTLSETHQISAEQQLSCPILALGGTEDSETTSRELEAWAAFTSGEFRARLLPGGHFFVRSAQGELLQLLREEGARHCRERLDQRALSVEPRSPASGDERPEPTEPRGVTAEPRSHGHGFTPSSEPDSLLARLARHAERHPQRPALIYLRDGEIANGSVGFGELWQRTRRVAAALAARYAQGSRVLLFFPAGLEFLPAFLGCLQAGLVAVPLPMPRLQRADPRLRALIADAAPACVLAATGDLAARDRGRLLDLPIHSLAELEQSAADFTSRGSQELAYLQYTSGSTASPKGVMIGHANVLHNCGLFQRALGCTEDDRLVSWLPHFHDLGLVFGQLLPVSVGFGVCSLPPLSFLHQPLRWLRAVSRYRATLSAAPNFAFDACLKSATPEQIEALDLSCLRAVINGAEPVRQGTVRAFSERFARAGFQPSALCPGYGLAEATLAVSMSRPDERPEFLAIDPNSNVPVADCGVPDPETRIQIVDPQTRAPRPPGAVGEIWVNSPSVALGYFGQPEASAEVFQGRLSEPDGQHYLRTGDLGVLSDGALFITGRLKDLLIFRGRNYYPQDIEATVSASHPAFTPNGSAAFSVPGADGEEELVVFQELSREQRRVPSAELALSVRNAVLQEFGLPLRAVALLGARRLPRTSSGKVTRQSCRAAFLSGEGPWFELLELSALSEANASVQPSQAVANGTAGSIAAEVERALARLTGAQPTPDQWRAPLVDLGLESLHALELVARLGQTCGVEPSLEQLLGGSSGLALIAELEAKACLPEAAEPSQEIAVDRQRQHEPFPLTDVQQAYWIGRSNELELGGVGCHGYVELSCRDLDETRLTSALNRLIRRHAMLRAVISEAGEQRVLPEAAHFEPCLEDLRALPQTERARRLAEQRERLSHRVFDVRRSPWLGVTVSRLDEHESVLHLDFDLLGFDYASLTVVSRELQLLYGDDQFELPELAVSFRDYVQAERASRQGARYQLALAYWRERAKDLPPAPALPLAIRPSELDRPRFVRREQHLSRELSERLRESARAQRVSISGLLLAAFSEIIARWSERPSFSLAVTWFDRPLGQLAGVVGDFTNILAFAIDVPRSVDFATRAQTLQRALWRDLEQRRVSGVRVLREAERGASLPALPVVFTSALGLGAADEGLPFGWLGKPIFSISQTPQVWLDHQAFEDQGELVLAWDAVDALFPPGLLDDMFAAYIGLLERLSQRDGAAFRELAPVQLPERQLALRNAANASAAPLPTGLLQHGFEAQALRQPGSIAVVAGQHRLSYGELEQASNALARVLRARGADRNERIGIALAKGPAQVVAALAIVKAGAAYVPLDPGLPAARVADMLEQAQARIVLSERAQRGISAWPAEIELLEVDALPELSEPEIARAEDSRLRASQSASDLAYVIFTSGSTGKPKGVMIDHRGALNTISDVNRRFDVGPSDRVLALSALSFDLSVYDVFGLLAAGGAIVMPDPVRLRDPGHWLELLREQRVSLWNSVPALLEMLVEYCGGRGAPLPSTLRQVLLSGDWIPVSLPGRLRALAPDARVSSLGGATEAAIWSIVYPIERVDPTWKSIPYGKPLSNQSFHVLDQALSPTPEWVAGDLYIAGVGVALGYIGDEARTRERFIVHPGTGERSYWTGDLGRYLPDGNLEFLGRADLQVKIQGYRIELEEIEAALLACDGVRAAAVLAEPTASGGKRLVACVAAEPEQELSGALLRAALASRLPSYMLPASFYFLDHLPLTANGKVDRRQLSLSARSSAGSSSSSSPASPRSALSSSFYGLCRDLLQRDGLGADDNFFALGGDSLLATRLSSRLREAYGVELRLQFIFEHPRLGELLSKLERLERATVPVPATRASAPQVLSAAPGQAEQPFPLTDVQYAYWLGRSRAFSLGGVACQGYVELDCTALDAERLRMALTRLARRHPMLRAVVDESARQRVLTEVSVELPLLDLRGQSPAEQALALTEQRERWSHAILPCNRAPLFRMAVTRLSETRSRLHWNVDLLILDYWSFRIVARELRQLYEQPEREPAPLGLTFRDYVLQQKSQEQGPEYQASVAYWRARAPELPPAPALPLAREPSELRGARFRRRRAELPSERWLRLRECAKRFELSASSLLLAAFSETLARFSREPRFTLNVTLFDRAAIHPDVERVVGDFTTVTLLGVDWREPSFVERARALQHQLWRDLDHRRVSGVRVLGELSRNGGGAKPNGMPVVFTSTLRSEPIAERPLAWLGEEVFGISQTPQVWLDHQLGEDERGLFLIWDAVEELFPEGLLDAMFASYLASLHALADGTFEAAQGPELSGAVSRVEPAASIAPEGTLDKLRFKLERRALRRELRGARLPLARPELGAARLRELSTRRSFRHFVQGAVPSERLSSLLSALIQEQVPGLPFPKASYGSAGGLYPVQVYCSIKPQRVQGLAGGTYYYDPDAHALVQLGGEDVPAELYPAINQALFQQAAFALFLVADRAAIEPAYGAYWRDFALLEAGAMCQLLESRAGDRDLGLCQVGALAFERVRAAFGLDESRYVYLHGLLGGGVLPEQQTLAALSAELSTPGSAVTDGSGKERAASPRVPSTPPPAAAVESVLTADAPWELRLLAIWQELLQRDGLTPEDRFFEVGGNSLLVVQLANRIREELGQEIPVLLLFEQPTVALQAAYLRAQHATPLSVASEQPAASARQEAGAGRVSDQERRERLRRARLEFD